MIPFGNDSVTLIRRVETIANGKTVVTYKKDSFNRCSWRRVAVTRRVDRQIERGEETVCRMPPESRPACGDVVILGSVGATPKDSAELDTIMEAHRNTGAMRITSVSDLTRPGFPLPHFAVRGE